MLPVGPERAHSRASGSGWINTGPTEDGHAVTLHRVCSTRLLGLDTPNMTTSFSFPDVSFDPLGSLGNGADYLFARYQRFGGTSDLDTPITLGEDALNIHPYVNPTGFHSLNKARNMFEPSIFYASQEYWNPQPTNNMLERAVSANPVVIVWKGDVTIVKHDRHCSSSFADVSKGDCDIIVTAAMYNGHMY